MKKTKIVVGILAVTALMAGFLAASSRRVNALDGDGSADFPFRLSTCLQLQGIQVSPTSHYALSADINCADDSGGNNSIDWNSGAGFAPITSFSGSLDGQGYTISGVTINRPGTDRQGIFGTTSGAIITDLKLDTITVTGNDLIGGLIGYSVDTSVSGVTATNVNITAAHEGGGLVGEFDKSSGSPSMTMSSTSGLITISGWNGGGLVGGTYQAGINNSYSTATVDGSTVADSIGGLVGTFYNGANFEDNYGAGTVNGHNDVGGMIGFVYGQSGSPLVQHNFSVTAVTGVSETGGFAGRIYNIDNTPVTDNYFDQTTSGQTNCDGATGAYFNGGCAPINSDGTDGDHFKNTSSIAPFSGNWDFDTIWKVGTDSGSPAYPTFQAITPDVLAPFTLPGVPTDLAAGAATDPHQTHVSWTAPTDTGHADVSYTVRYRIKDSSDSWTEASVAGTSVDVTLTPNDQFELQVESSNVAGDSDWSDLYYYTVPNGNTPTITTCIQLQAIMYDPTGSYTLNNDINCADGSTGNDSSTWNDGAGFQPIDNFSGTLDGQGFTITGLVSVHPEDTGVGMFSNVLAGASISNFHMTASQVVGSTNVGVLAGEVDGGTITGITSDAMIVGQDEVGGLIGIVNADGNDVSISHLTTSGTYDSIDNGSPATDIAGVIGAIQAFDTTTNLSYLSSSMNFGSFSDGPPIQFAGGTIGGVTAFDDANVTMDHITSSGAVVAAGSILGGPDFEGGAGGLIGYINTNWEDTLPDAPTVTLDLSNSTGDTMLCGNGCGGFVGTLNAFGGSAIHIQRSYSSEPTVGFDGLAIGGLVGFATADTTGGATISASFANGNVQNEPGQFTGGLVGFGEGDGLAVSDSYSTGEILAGDLTGGLIGETDGSVTNSYSSSSTEGGNDVGGLVGGLGLYSGTGSISGSFYNSGLLATDGLEGAIVAETGENATITNSWYDSVTFGQDGLCASYGDFDGCQPTDPTTFLGNHDNPPFTTHAVNSPDVVVWDFDTLWGAHPGRTPTFQWYEAPATPNIPTCAQLQAMADQPTWDYTLINNINCADASTGNDTSTWNDGAGFIPIQNFTGSLDGGGFTISNLHINADGAAGLFADTEGANIHDVTISGDATVSGGGNTGVLIGSMNNGTLSNVHTNESATLTDPLSFVGGLVGQISCASAGTTTVDTVSSSGTVTYPATDANWGYGGLVGHVDSEASGCHTTFNNTHSSSQVSPDQDVASGLDIGGLIGEIDCFISSDNTVVVQNSFATGDVNNAEGQAGGLVGLVWADDGASVQLLRTYATGQVITGSDSQEVGGLVGFVHGGSAQIGQSYATGNIYGFQYVGGLVGQIDGQEDISLIDQSYTTNNIYQTVSNGSFFGGLVGDVQGASISNSYSTAHLYSDGGYTGGLVGRMLGDISNSYAAGTIMAGVTTPLGGLVGDYEGTNSSAQNGLKSNFADEALLFESGPASYYGTLVGFDEMAGFIPNIETNWVDSSSFNGGACSYNSDRDTPSTQACNSTGYQNFQNSSTNEPFTDGELPVWDFTSTWTIKSDDFPRLQWDYTAPVYDITNCQQLQAMNNDLQGAYTLHNDIDCGDASTGNDTTTWNDGQGFIPIGISGNNGFHGTLDGQGYVIRNLFEDRSTSDNGDVGLMYETTNATLTDFSVNNSSFTGKYDAGAIVVYAYTTSISQVSSNATVTTTLNDDGQAGGLVGYFYGGGDFSISQSYYTGALSGTLDVGGLAGALDTGVIIDSYSNGTVSLTNGGDYAGGLVGYIYQSVLSQSYSASPVTLTSGGDDVGGLVGASGGSTVIESSFATGTVTAAMHSGALAGLVDTGNLSVSDSYFDYTNGFQDGCVEDDDYEGCTAVNTPGAPDNNYFKDNSSNPPMAGVWDFQNTWSKSADNYPVLGWNPQSAPDVQVYNITNCAQLQAVENDLAGHYTLANDIDCEMTNPDSLAFITDGPWADGAGFVPIGEGSQTGFTGTFDGQGHTISKIFEDRTLSNDSQFAGLFFQTTDATLTNFAINDSQFNGSNFAGAVAAFATTTNANKITSNATVSDENDEVTGGLFGVLNGNSDVSESSFTGNVSASWGVGGIAGSVEQSQIENSYSQGTVTVLDGGSNAGGLAGYLQASAIFSSYSSASIGFDGGGNIAGGLVGDMGGESFIADSFAAGAVASTVDNSGGLVGTFDEGGGTLQNSSYDRDRTGQIGCVDNENTDEGCVQHNGEGGEPNYYFDTLQGREPMNSWDWNLWHAKAGDYPVLTQSASLQISTCDQLQAISDNLSANYVLTQNINCAGSENWNDGQGFLPIGMGSEDSFTGALSGNGHIISNLTQNRENASHAPYATGLFQSMSNAWIADFRIADSSFTGDGDGGSIAPYAEYTQVQDVSSDAQVTLLLETNSAGGLFGSFIGDPDAHYLASIRHSYFDGTVSGSWNTGGLVGYSEDATLTDTYSKGTVILLNGQQWAGGLVGSAWATDIHTSYSSSQVTLSAGGTDIGGLVGGAGGASTINDSFAAGPVDGIGGAGGLVADVTGGGDVTFNNSFYDVAATGIASCTSAGDADGCTPVDTGQDGDPTGPDYFINNQSNPPLDQWDFNDEGGWVTNTSDFPTFTHIVYDYTISDCSDLQNMNSDLYAHYTLLHNIDCSDSVNWNGGQGFIPIGQNNAFQGTLDGTSQNYKITGLFEDRSLGDPDFTNFGLFGNTYQATLENFSVNDSSLSGSYQGGAISAYSTNTHASNLHSNATVTNTASYSTGGLFGTFFNWDAVDEPTYTLSQSSYTGTVSGSDVVGGLVGVTENTDVSNSFANTLISISGQEAGGLIGQVQGHTNLLDSYSAGVVSTGDRYAGGLIGTNFLATNTITNSFSTAVVEAGNSQQGGLVGTDTTGGPPTFINSYYDQALTGQSGCFDGSDVTGCTAVNTMENQDDNYFINNQSNPPLNQWDFDTVWHSHANNYPTFTADQTSYDISSCADLQAMNNDMNGVYTLTKDIDCSDTVNWNDGTGWQPLGGFGNAFTGTLNGAGFSISDLYLNRAPSGAFGLFVNSDNATIENLGLTGTIINPAVDDGSCAGGLIGYSTDGLTIANVTSTLNVLGGPQDTVGGLVGCMIDETAPATITGTTVNATITGSSGGGFTGETNLNPPGTLAIADSSTAGNLDCSSGACGGFAEFLSYTFDSEIPRLAFTIDRSSSSMDIQADEGPAGGMVGLLTSNGLDTTISNSNFTGALTVVGGGETGGFIGQTFFERPLANSDDFQSFAEADVSASGDNVGGLIGDSGENEESDIDNSYYKGSVSTLGNNAGGLIGNVENTATIDRSYGAGSVSSAGSFDDNGPWAGSLVGYLNAGSISNSFGAAAISTNPDLSYSASGLIGDARADFVTFTNDYYNDDTGSGNCSDGDIDFIVSDQCTAIHHADMPDYFINNSTSPPLDTWSFSDIWHTRVGDYPNLSPINEPQIECQEINPGTTSVDVNCDAWPTGWGQTNWVMQYRKLSDSSWTDVALPDVHQAVATLGGLTPGTNYRVQFQFVNDWGTSQWGHIDFTTLGSSTTTASSGGGTTGTKKKAATSTASAAAESTDPKIVLNDFSDFFAGGKQLDLRVNQVVYFVVKGKEHYATVTEVGDDFVTINFDGSSVGHRLTLGQAGQYDVTGDGVNDIEVTLNSLTNGVATLTFRSLANGVASQPAGTTKYVAARSIIDWYWIALFCGGIVVMIAIVISRRVKLDDNTRGP